MKMTSAISDGVLRISADLRLVLTAKLHADEGGLFAWDIQLANDASVEQSEIALRMAINIRKMPGVKNE